MNDRHAEGYVPDFDLDQEYGRQGELFVQDICAALAGGASVEVKRDSKFEQTGNVYVEYECQHFDGEWHRSGIAITTAEVWCFVLGGGMLAVPTWKLKIAARKLYVERDGYRKSCLRGSNPTRGLAVPLLILLAEIGAVSDGLREEAA